MSPSLAPLVDDVDGAFACALPPRLSLSSPHIPHILRVRENACSTKGDEKGGRKGKREGRLGWVVTANGVDAMTIIIIIGGGREGLRRKEERESVC